MAKKRPPKGTDAGKEPRETTTIRCYWEQGELLNRLADVGECKNIAEAIEKFLDSPMREILKRLYTEQAKRL